MDFDVAGGYGDMAQAAAGVGAGMAGVVESAVEGAIDATIEAGNQIGSVSVDLSGAAGVAAAAGVANGGAAIYYDGQYAGSFAVVSGTMTYWNAQGVQMGYYSDYGANGFNGGGGG